ncbi:MAG: type II toxin-antitoxin system CcdA family antitoxin [Mesorhizobium sp.]|jgi:antitoxin CcdA
MSRMSAQSQRKPTNVSIDSNLIAEAKELEVNISRAAEAGIAKAVADEKARRWLEENKEAIESSNRFVEENGLPLAKYRPF